MGSAACFIWDLLPAFCGICCLPSVELSLLCVGHTTILLWKPLCSVGPAAYFLWDSLPAFDGNHYLFPMNLLLPVSTGPVTPLPPAWTNVRPHPPGTTCPSVPCLASVEPTASLLWPPPHLSLALRAGEAGLFLSQASVFLISSCVRPI